MNGGQSNKLKYADPDGNLEPAEKGVKARS